MRFPVQTALKPAKSLVVVMNALSQHSPTPYSLMIVRAGRGLLLIDRSFAEFALL
jgi:hypothetical protein